MSLLSLTSLRLQLLVMVLIVALPATGIIIHTGLEQRKDAIHKAHVDSLELADSISAEQKNLVNASEQLLQALAQLPEIRKRDREQVRRILADILKINPQYLNIFVAGGDGYIWGSGLPLPNSFQVADRLYFKNAVATGRFSSGEYIVGRILSRPTISFGYPVRDMKGRINGVIALNINLEYFRDVVERLKLPPRSGYMLVDRNGVILGGGLTPTKYVGKPDKRDLFQRMISGPEADTFLGQGLDGTERILTYRKLYLKGELSPYIYIRATIQPDVAQSKATRVLTRNMLLMSSFLLLALIMAWYLGKKSILDPIMALKGVASRLAAGDLTARLAGRIDGAELSLLGSALDSMADSLAGDIKKREQVEHELHEQARLLEAEVAERQRAEEELAYKQRQLEELNLSLEERIASALSELRSKDQMLIQQSRLAALGEMLNNIAHQWRQPLNNVGLIIQNLRESYELGDLTPDELRAEVDKAMDTIQFMSRTINDFRNFSSEGKQRRVFLINEVVCTTLELVSENLRHSSIKLELDIQGTVPAYGLPNEYSQVLLNIINNARDALLERTVQNPMITIRVFQEDGRSVATVTDNGGGIDAEIFPKIFDPYFTTKHMAQGTGIGLYMSKMIIEKNMAGTLSARNIDNGAEFRVELPIAEGTPLG